MISKLVIKDRVWQKFMHFVDKAPGEVSGLGSVEVINGIPVVTDVFLCKQNNSGASTDLDANDVAILMYEHRDKDLRWWVHSHANMAVFWSSTDEDTIQELGGNGWIIATVVNKKRETKSAFFTKAKITSGFSTIETNIFDENIATEIECQAHQEAPEWDKEYDKTCSSKVTTWRETMDDRMSKPYYSLYTRSGCCKTWDDFLEHHKDEILAYESQTPEQTHQYVDEQFSISQGYLPDASLAEIGAEVEDLIKGNLSKEEVITTIVSLFGGEWEWYAGAHYDKLKQEEEGWNCYAQ